MDALRALDPRTGADFEALTPRLQFIQLARYGIKCTGSLKAVVEEFMATPCARYRRLSDEARAAIDGLAAYLFAAAADPHDDSLAALQAADPQRCHAMLDLMLLSEAREELARGPTEFAATFAGLPPTDLLEVSTRTYRKRRGGAELRNDGNGEEAVASNSSDYVPAASAPEDMGETYNSVADPALSPGSETSLDALLGYVTRTMSAQESWNVLYKHRISNYMSAYFGNGDGFDSGPAAGYEDISVAGERHMQLLLEPRVPAALFGDLLVKRLDCVAACRPMSSGASPSQGTGR